MPISPIQGSQVSAHLVFLAFLMAEEVPGHSDSSLEWIVYLICQVDLSQDWRQL